MLKVIFNLFIAFLVTFPCSGQENYDNIKFEDYIYYDHIKSVSLIHKGLVTTLPIINLSKPGVLSLTFDDLEGGDNYYTYRIIHCDRNWSPSDLDEYDYIDGYNGQQIWNPEYSIGTQKDYTKYTLSIPNEDINWILSGNYLLVVYEGDPEESTPVISRRIMVIEPMASVIASTGAPIQVDILRTHQQISLAISPYEGIRLKNPLVDIYATVLQNGRWDNAAYNIQPKFQAGTKINWDRTTGITLPALKEFRSVDFRSLTYRAQNVFAIERYDDATDITLETGIIRDGINFNRDIDLNGTFFIDNEDKDYSKQLTAEYANILFSLEVNAPFLDDVYIVGAFTDWLPKAAYKMTYDQTEKLYSADILLKQGYYDYMFGVKQDETINCAPIEGSWYETENNYAILIYYSEFGSRYDQLIAAQVINSSN